MPERKTLAWFVAVALSAACAAVRVDAQNLHDFLRQVEVAATPKVALRADGTIVIDSGDKTRRDQIVLMRRPPGDLYVELRETGVRALLLDGGKQAWRVVKGESKAEPFATTATLGDSDFTREDLQPFRLTRFADVRTSDDSGNELTVSLFPTSSQYSLLVTTFDRDKKAALKTIFYRDTLNNAVKMRRNTDLTQIGDSWLPATISMETFRLKTRTTLNLVWKQDPSLPPQLFDPASLAQPSKLAWPAATKNKD